MSWARLAVILIALASVTGVSGQRSAERKADTPVRTDAASASEKSVSPQAAMGTGVSPLRAADNLIEALETENAALRTRLETEKTLTSLLSELNETRKSEAQALTAALMAKNESLTAKDAVIDLQEKQIAELKKRKSSPLKRLGDILIGIAAGALLR